MNSTAMQTTLHPDYTGTFTVNGHIVPVVQGIAMVLNGADVTAAQALGWTVLANQPNVAEPTMMQPPPKFLVGRLSSVAGSAGFVPIETAFPDGTLMDFRDPPLHYNGTESSSDTRKVCSVPAQWVEYAKAVHRFMPHPAF